MINYIRDLIGSPPVGFEFLEYIVEVSFACVGIYILYKIFTGFFQNIFH